MRHRIGRPRWTNCWLAFGQLLFTGRVVGFIFVWRWWVPHVAGITRRGNVLHFTWRMGSGRGLYPFWYHGGLELVAGPWWKQCERFNKNFVLGKAIRAA